MKIIKLASSISVVFLSIVFSSGTLHAGGVYKCVDENGATTYSQTSCGDTRQVQITRRTITNPSDVSSCRIAEEFALSISEKMRGGTPSGTVFRQYGGMDSIDPTAMSLINYVYTFKLNYRATSERIARLTGTRCLAGSFGPVTCEKFPRSFLGEVGGCALNKPASDEQVASQARTDGET